MSAAFVMISRKRTTQLKIEIPQRSCERDLTEMTSYLTTYVTSLLLTIT